MTQQGADHSSTTPTRTGGSKATLIGVLRRIKLDMRTEILPGITPTSPEEAWGIVERDAYGVNSRLVKPGDFNECADVFTRPGCCWLLLNRALRGSS